MGTALSEQRAVRPFEGVTRGRAVHVRADAAGIEYVGTSGCTRQRSTSRPTNGGVRYDASQRSGSAGTQVSRAHGPSHGRKTPLSGVTAVVATFVVTAGVVAGLDAIANLRLAQTDSVPAATDTVQVRRGESLGDVAARVAPDAPVAQVVDRIVELNALAGAEVRPGQVLISPVSHGG